VATTHRVLLIHTAPGIPLYGNHGGALHLREVIRAMDALGHRVTVVTRRRVRRAGDPQLPLPAQVIEPPRGTLPGVLQRVPQVDETAYDLRLRVTLREICCRVEPTLIYERFSLFSAAGMRVARQRRIPGVLEVNAPLAQERETQEGLRAGRWTRDRERRVLRAAARVIAVSPGVAEYVRSRGVPGDRVRVIPNGVDPQRFSPRPRGAPPAELPQLQRPFVIGFCGSLKPWHDLETLLDALAGEAALQEAALLVIGDGPRRAELRKRTTDLGIDARVAWAGERSEDEVPDLLALCHAVCVPGAAVPGDYFSPLKLLEAMALRLPVVASDLAGVRLVAGADDASVLLVPPGDAAALGRALARLAGDAGLRDRLGAANRARAEEHTWQHVVEESLEGL